MTNTNEMQLSLFGEEETKSMEVETKNTKKATSTTKSKGTNKKDTKNSNNSNNSKDKKDNKTGSKTPGKEEKFKYPFALYTNGGCVDIREFGFEDGKEYTGNEIAKIMLQHKFYEFSAERKNFKYFKEDNVIYYSGADFKKG